jgi:hypothetical protein
MGANSAEKNKKPISTVIMLKIGYKKQQQISFLETIMEMKRTR